MLLDEHQEEALSIKSPRSGPKLYHDLFRYLRSDSGLLFKSIGAYALSLLLVSLISSYLFLDSFPRIENIVFLKNRVSKPQYLMVVVNSLVYVASFCMLSWVVNRALLLRDENRSEHARILQGALRKNFGTGLKNYLGNFLILYLVYWLIDYFDGFLLKTLVFSDEGSLSVYPLNDIANTIMKWLIPALLFSPLFYYGFSTLFVSAREDIGASDAFKKVMDISSVHTKKIWIQSLFLLFFASILDLIFHEVFYGIGRSVTAELNFVFFFFIGLMKISTFFLVAMLQITAILLFGSIEAAPIETNETETIEN